MMGITDPGQGYFKDGGWHWDGSGWIKGGLAFEYAGQIMGVTFEGDAAAGVNDVFGVVVPADEIWVLTGMCVVDDDNATTGSTVGVAKGASYYWLSCAGALGAGLGFTWGGSVCLVEGDRPYGTKKGCTAGDDLRLFWFGYRMRLT